jgi:hypothetical protein
MSLWSFLEFVGPAVCVVVAGLVLRWLVLGITLWWMWRSGIDEMGPR